MYYIYYHKKSGDKGLQEIPNQKDVILWLLNNSKNCNLIKYKIFESPKELILTLTEKYIKAKCKKCDDYLGELNYSGFCKNCYAEGRTEKFTRKCHNPDCDNKIADWNKSGLCVRCFHKTRSEKEGNKEKKEQIKKKLEEEKPKEENQIEFKKGKCRKCKVEFKLESWQHSTMHWCLKCQNSPEYKEFKQRQRA